MNRSFGGDCRLSKEAIMKLRSLFCSTLVSSLALVAGQTRSIGASATSASEIPHLRKHGTATQLAVDGKPFLMLAGELHNNTATSLEYIKPIWTNLVEANFNTALVGVSWNQIEPKEGKFDFKVLDGVIKGARNTTSVSCRSGSEAGRTVCPATRPTG